MFSSKVTKTIYTYFGFKIFLFFLPYRTSSELHSDTSDLAVLQKYSEIQSGAGGVARLCIAEYTAHHAPT